MVDKVLLWDEWVDKLFPKLDFGGMLLDAMATNLHFTAADADLIIMSIPRQGRSTSDLLRGLRETPERDQTAAFIVLWNSILRFEEKKQSWFLRKGEAAEGALPTVEEIRNQVPPHGLSIVAFFNYFFSNIPYRERSTFVVRAKRVLRSYPEMELLFRKSIIYFRRLGAFPPKSFPPKSKFGASWSRRPARRPS